MINPIVYPQTVVYHGVRHLPCNVCARCGYNDDPETAQTWGEDEDGDRVCRKCEKEINQSLAVFYGVEL